MWPPEEKGGDRDSEAQPAVPQQPGGRGHISFPAPRAEREEASAALKESTLTPAPHGPAPSCLGPGAGEQQSPVPALSCRDLAAVLVSTACPAARCPGHCPAPPGGPLQFEVKGRAAPAAPHCSVLDAPGHLLSVACSHPLPPLGWTAALSCQCREVPPYLELGHREHLLHLCVWPKPFLISLYQF